MNDVIFLWGGWLPVVRIIVVGTLTYLGIILILRVSGKRTLASMNAFDFIITVAMGSAFGRILTARTVSVAEALVAFLLLICLQFIITYIETRSKGFHRLMTSQPALLYYKGNFIEKNLQRERLRKNDLLGAVRKNNFGDLSDVEAIVLETDGTFSIIRKKENSGRLTYGELLERNL